MAKQILLVEDDQQLSTNIRLFLENEGFQVQPVFDGNIALKAFEMDDFDLILLDVNIPGVNGLELCKKMRSVKANTPIIMITAFGDIDTKMEAFNFGADDFLVKPFHLRELIAKVKIFIKRSETQPISEGRLEIGDLVMDVQHKRVHRDGQNIDLTPKEFALLEYLLRHKDRVISKDELARNVWNEDFGVSANSIEVYISFLRNKVDKKFGTKLIKTKTGFGYFIEA